MSPQDYVQQKAAASGSSFYYAFLFLPPERRAAITAFYAFCREVDDVVDEVSDPGVAATKLAWWQKEVQQAFAVGRSPLHHVCLGAAVPALQVQVAHARPELAHAAGHLPGVAVHVAGRLHPRPGRV